MNLVKFLLQKPDRPLSKLLRANLDAKLAQLEIEAQQGEQVHAAAIQLCKDYLCLGSYTDIRLGTMLVDLARTDEVRQSRAGADELSVKQLLMQHESEPDVFATGYIVHLLTNGLLGAYFDSISQWKNRQKYYAPGAAVCFEQGYDLAKRLQLLVSGLEDYRDQFLPSTGGAKILSRVQSIELQDNVLSNDGVVELQAVLRALIFPEPPAEPTSLSLVAFVQALIAYNEAVDKARALQRVELKCEIVRSKLHEGLRLLNQFGVTEQSLSRVFTRQPYQQQYNDRVIQQAFLDFLVENPSVLQFLADSLAASFAAKPLRTQLQQIFPEKTLFADLGFWHLLAKQIPRFAGLHNRLPLKVIPIAEQAIREAVLKQCAVAQEYRQPFAKHLNMALFTTALQYRDSKNALLLHRFIVMVKSLLLHGAKTNQPYKEISAALGKDHMAAKVAAQVQTLQDDTANHSFLVQLFLAEKLDSAIALFMKSLNDAAESTVQRLLIQYEEYAYIRQTPNQNFLPRVIKQMQDTMVANGHASSAQMWIRRQDCLLYEFVANPALCKEFLDVDFGGILSGEMLPELRFVQYQPDCPAEFCCSGVLGLVFQGSESALGAEDLGDIVDALYGVLQQGSYSSYATHSLLQDAHERFSSELKSSGSPQAARAFGEISEVCLKLKTPAARTQALLGGLLQHGLLKQFLSTLGTLIATHPDYLASFYPGAFVYTHLGSFTRQLPDAYPLPLLPGVTFVSEAIRQELKLFGTNTPAAPEEQSETARKIAFKFTALLRSSDAETVNKAPLYLWALLELEAKNPAAAWRLIQRFVELKTAHGPYLKDQLLVAKTFMQDAEQSAPERRVFSLLTFRLLQEASLDSFLQAYAYYQAETQEYKAGCLWYDAALLAETCREIKEIQASLQRFPEHDVRAIIELRHPAEYEQIAAFVKNAQQPMYSTSADVEKLLGTLAIILAPKTNHLYEKQIRNYIALITEGAIPEAVLDHMMRQLENCGIDNPRSFRGIKNMLSMFLIEMCQTRQAMYECVRALAFRHTSDAELVRKVVKFQGTYDINLLCRLERDLESYKADQTPLIVNVHQVSPYVEYQQMQEVRRLCDNAPSTISIKTGQFYDVNEYLRQCVLRLHHTPAPYQFVDFVLIIITLLQHGCTSSSIRGALLSHSGEELREKNKHIIGLHDDEMAFALVSKLTMQGTLLQLVDIVEQFRLDSWKSYGPQSYISQKQNVHFLRLIIPVAEAAVGGSDVILQAVSTITKLQQLRLEKFLVDWLTSNATIAPDFERFVTVQLTPEVKEVCRQFPKSDYSCYDDPLKRVSPLKCGTALCEEDMGLVLQDVLNVLYWMAVDQELIDIEIVRVAAVFNAQESREQLRHVIGQMPTHHDAVIAQIRGCINLGLLDEFLQHYSKCAEKYLYYPGAIATIPHEIPALVAEIPACQCVGTARLFHPSIPYEMLVETSESSQHVEDRLQHIKDVEQSPEEPHDMALSGNEFTNIEVNTTLTKLATSPLNLMQNFMVDSLELKAAATAEEERHQLEQLQSEEPGETGEENPICEKQTDELSMHNSSPSRQLQKMELTDSESEFGDVTMVAVQAPEQQPPAPAAIQQPNKNKQYRTPSRLANCGFFKGSYLGLQPMISIAIFGEFDFMFESEFYQHDYYELEPEQVTEILYRERPDVLVRQSPASLSVSDLTFDVSQQIFIQQPEPENIYILPEVSRSPECCAVCGVMLDKSLQREQAGEQTEHSDLVTLAPREQFLQCSYFNALFCDRCVQPRYFLSPTPSSILTGSPLYVSSLGVEAFNYSYYQQSSKLEMHSIIFPEYQLVRCILESYKQKILGCTTLKLLLQSEGLMGASKRYLIGSWAPADFCGVQYQNASLSALKPVQDQFLRFCEQNKKRIVSNTFFTQHVASFQPIETTTIQKRLLAMAAAVFLHQLGCEKCQMFPSLCTNCGEEVQTATGLDGMAAVFKAKQSPLAICRNCLAICHALCCKSGFCPACAVLAEPQ